MKIEHDESGHRFTVVEPEGKGELVYDVPKPDVLDLEFVGVAPILRGKGIAAALTEAAVVYARRIGAHIIPTCSYVRAWLRRHPEHMDLIDAQESW